MNEPLAATILAGLRSTSYTDSLARFSALLEAGRWESGDDA